MDARSLFAVSFRLIAFTFFGTALVAAFFSLRFVNNSMEVQGRVVEFAVEQNAVPFMRSEEPTGLIYYPIVEYVDSTGAEARFQARRGQSDPDYEIGETVTVLVARDNSQARLATLLGKWGTPLVLGGLALLFLLISLLAPMGFGGSTHGKNDG